ncbi:MAG: putative transcriptional regulator [Pseudonocardiales bacterium]|nr:putative transcriptional regulator [Pseudonocardiales bacterium]
MLEVVTTTFEVLAEPNRRRILDLLRQRERPVGELVAELNASQPAVSKHLRVLREAGLVAVTTDAQRRLYRLNPEPLKDVAEWLEPYRALWGASLDALERHLDDMDDMDEMDEMDDTDGRPAATGPTRRRHR